jgi:hypothetical protein
MEKLRSFSIFYSNNVKDIRTNYFTCGAPEAQAIDLSARQGVATDGEERCGRCRRSVFSKAVRSERWNEYDSTAKWFQSISTHGAL